METIAINFPKNLKLSDDQFEDLISANRDSKFELTATGELLIMSPTGGETGNRNFELYIDLGNWNRKKGLGKAFDSSTGFQLPNGAKRSPDLSWITLEKWNALTPTQRRKFLPICPDFVTISWRATKSVITSLSSKATPFAVKKSFAKWQK